MSTKKKSQYHKIDSNIHLEIYKILKGSYEQAIFGSINETNFPFLSKILPLYLENNIYLLLSDLSEHTKNIVFNQKSSIYYVLKEKHKQKLNNPRLTLIGVTKKLKLKKSDKQYQKLLSQYSLIESAAAMWGNFDDFNFYIFNIHQYLYVKGFGKAYIKILNK